MFFDKKRREGIYSFNKQLISQGNEAKMREKRPNYEDNLRVCLNCKGFYSNKHFTKHKCVTQKPEPLNPKLLQAPSDDTIDKDKDFKQIL